MSVNNKNTTYEDFPKIATEIENLAVEFNTTANDAFLKFNTMKQWWYGRYYDILAESFMNLKKPFESILELMLVEIPRYLRDAANLYANLNRLGKIASGGKSVIKLCEIQKSNETRHRFKLNEVQQSQNSIYKDFDKMLDLMNKMQSANNKIDWQSESGETYKSKFDLYKKQATDYISKTKAEFKKQMTDANSENERVEAKLKNAASGK